MQAVFKINLSEAGPLVILDEKKGLHTQTFFTIWCPEEDSATQAQPADWLASQSLLVLAKRAQARFFLGKD